jgi:pimeloyl-ACP methyl ester carboxylesterase
MTAFILVHGAWHGGWCWHKVAQRLAAKGHRVEAPDFPGHGRDETPIADVTLESIVARICETIDRQSEPAVLVGHSYGGAIISQASELRPAKVKTLVYLTAILAADGQTPGGALAGDKEGIGPTHLDYALDGKTATVKNEALKPVFYGDCSDEDIAYAARHLRPEAIAGLQTPLMLSPEKWGRIPRVYIECTKDRAISLARQRQMVAAIPCGHIVTLETDHSPFFSMPDALAEILATL